MFRALEGLAAGTAEPEDEQLRSVDACFAGQIATSVWLGYMTDAAAREALLSYAVACRLRESGQPIGLREALLAEYRRCRERQDLVS